VDVFLENSDDSKVKISIDKGALDGLILAWRVAA